MILLTLSRGKGEETVRLQLPASPAEIGETFAFLDRISLDTTATAILDVSSNVPVLYRCLYDVDVEDSEQFQKLQKLAERTEALSPAKAAIFSGALDAECVWNLEGALTVADRLDEYMLVNNVSSDSELGIYLVNKGITPFPDRFKPYINYARVGAEYREKHGGEYSSGNYVQKKTPELLENERLDGVFRIWMENPCPVRVGGNPRPISPGSTGKLDYIDDAGQFHVKWDNGCTLALVLGEDRFSVYLPEPQTFKLYMPLTADFYGRDEWGDMSEDGEEWDGHTLMDYEGQILSALVKNRVPEENESGLMRWYGEDDSVDHKVRSAVFTVEVRNRQLWGVAECRVAGELTPEELIRRQEKI